MLVSQNEQCPGVDCPAKCKRRHQRAMRTFGHRDPVTNLWDCPQYVPDLRPGVWETGEKSTTPIRQAV